MDGEDGGESGGECVVEEFPVSHLLICIVLFIGLTEFKRKR